MEEMKMAVLLEAKDLCKTYVLNKRQNNVLKNVNFAVEGGEMVAIMGPSGSGKSTLLYTISGMDKATSGRVTFGEQDITKLSDNELAALRLDEMGFIFQQMYMMKNLTILDNIVLPAVQSKKIQSTKKEKVKRGEELMRKLGIIEVADNDINEVSGGQLQRACICRSMINNPKILFADEPTGALNRTASNEVMKELVKLNEEGTTIMMVTHDAKVAAMCSRILYIVDGNIKGEYKNNKSKDMQQKERERALNNWLLDLGW
jgi:putative ABC transport system ATP-binding protein